MSFAGAFSDILGRYGQTVTLYRDGVLLGTGLALVQPVLGDEQQFVPSELGVWENGKFLCMGEAGLPFAPATGETVLECGGVSYDVRNCKAVMAGTERVYWRAVLTVREGVTA